MTLLLDSTFVIDHFRQDASALARWTRVFADDERVCINEVVVCEVRAGLRTEQEPIFVAFLEPIEFIQPDSGAALVAGRWRALARQRGHTLSLADALIAAAAQTVGAAVLTRNVRDFELTPVRVETY
jgi:predicted nucleic acid-binding protein